MDVSIPLPFIAAAGAIAAALLTGLFSFVNLVLSKELKISDARLAWNDALRADVNAMLAHIETLARLAEHTLSSYKAEHPNHSAGFTPTELATFRDVHKKEYLALNEARHRIGLRLNPVEGQHQELARNIDDLVVAFRGDCANVDPIFAKANRVIVESQRVLRSTWDKVKVGEDTFASTKKFLRWGLYGLAGFGLVLLLTALVSLLTKPPTTQPAPQVASPPAAASPPATSSPPAK